MKHLFSFLLITFSLLFVESCGDYNNEPNADNAITMAEPLVKDKMSYPEEVKFDTSTRRVAGEGKTEFTVYEKFTAPNAFGMKREFIFKAVMKYLGGDKYEDSSWECETLIIEDTHTGEQWR